VDRRAHRLPPAPGDRPFGKPQRGAASIADSSSRVARSRSRAGTTRVTKPSACASAAPIGVPVMKRKVDDLIRGPGHRVALLPFVWDQARVAYEWTWEHRGRYPAVCIAIVKDA